MNIYESGGKAIARHPAVPMAFKTSLTATKMLDKCSMDTASSEGREGGREGGSERVRERESERRGPDVIPKLMNSLLQLDVCCKQSYFIRAISCICPYPQFVCLFAPLLQIVRSIIICFHLRLDVSYSSMFVAFLPLPICRTYCRNHKVPSLSTRQRRASTSLFLICDSGCKCIILLVQVFIKRMISLK